MPRFNANEFGDVFEALAKHEYTAARDDGQIAESKCEQAIASARRVDDVNCFEVDAFSRKKLFRPQTATSARLGE